MTAFFRTYWKWLVALLLLGLALRGCSDTLTWKEEVRLSDGRVVVVTQKRRYEGVYTGHNFGKIPREAWLTIRLPEFGDQDITWHEKLGPLVVNIHQSKLYVVGWPPTAYEFRLYGKYDPPYRAFIYENRQWRAIPIETVPAAIYDVNLWVDNSPPNDTGFVSFADKAKEKRDPTLSNKYKRIDPSYVSNFDKI